MFLLFTLNATKHLVISACTFDRKLRNCLHIDANDYHDYVDRKLCKG